MSSAFSKIPANRREFLRYEKEKTQVSCIFFLDIFIETV